MHAHITKSKTLLLSKNALIFADKAFSVFSIGMYDPLRVQKVIFIGLKLNLA